jgi:16S rRNA (cytosine967-C5)-methyltransferase
LGTLRRNPDLKWRQNPKLIEALTGTQAAILQSAARLLKPGGRLVYATCSLLLEENEQIAEVFSAEHPEFKLLEAAEVLTQAGVQNAPNLCAGPFLRLWPHQHQTDGFFAAIWEKS